jgi:hypothetical protein
VSSVKRSFGKLLERSAQFLQRLETALVTLWQTPDKVPETFCARLRNVSSHGQPFIRDLYWRFSMAIDGIGPTTASQNEGGCVCIACKFDYNVDILIRFLLPKTSNLCILV